MKAIFALILFTVVSASAQPNGPFTVLMSSPVYDVSGVHYGDDEDAEVVFDVTHQANGALSGSAVATYDDGFMSLDGTGPITGRVTGNAFQRRGRFRFVAPVTGYDLDGAYYTGSYTWTGGGLHEGSAEGLFLGNGTAAGCVRGLGCRRNPVSIEVPSGSGVWELDLNLATEGKVVTGTATARHANGRTFSYSVRGRYSAKTARSNLTLTGTGDGLGSKLNVVATGNLIVNRVTGKLLGQAVKHQP